MFAILSILAAGKQWAVLMAGSRGYNNYRHQADVFRIYDILRTRGMPKENIITLAYDDVVNHKKNPFPQQIFATKDHKNVYPGRENIDYTGSDATAENFLRVLTGDSHNGRALESTEDDDVFIYYDDHGAPGLLCVPANNGPEIYADHLSATVEKMRKEKKFGRILFVIEACYSGSVGSNISTPGVFVITAAGPQQSSFSAQWDEKLQTFRTNEFTQHFLGFMLENPEAKIIESVNVASKKTTHSHVQAFGDYKISQLPLSTFMRSAQPVEVQNGDSGDMENAVENGASNTMAFVNFLQRRLQAAETLDERRLYETALDSELERRERASRIFDGIARRIIPNGIPDGTPYVKDIRYSCYRAAIEGFRMFCGEIEENELSKLHIFTHLCEKSDIATILADIRAECPKLQWTEDQLYF